MFDAPLVSVIIPCYQAEEYIREALDSVKAQTYGNLEILAIEDGSTDNTLSILQEYAGIITILQHAGGVNRGVCLTRKLGIDLAKGKYIAFLDADDCFAPEKIELQVKCLENSPDAVLCHTAVNTIPESARDRDLENWFSISREPFEYDYKATSRHLRSNGICNSTVLARADIMRSLLLARGKMFLCEDWLAWNLAAECGPFIFLPERTTNYRLHSRSATSEINNSKLKCLFSGIEFYLALASRTRLTKTREHCTALLMERVEDVYCEYLDESMSVKRNEMRRQFRRALAKFIIRKYISKILFFR